MTISALLVTLLVSYLIPAAVALLTKSSATTLIKQVLGGLLSAITGLLVTATQLDGTALLSTSAVVLALGAFLSTQAAYTGLYKPHDANEALAPGVGLG